MTATTLQTTPTPSYDTSNDDTSTAETSTDETSASAFPDAPGTDQVPDARSVLRALQQIGPDFDKACARMDADLTRSLVTHDTDTMTDVHDRYDAYATARVNLAQHYLRTATDLASTLGAQLGPQLGDTADAADEADADEEADIAAYYDDVAREDPLVDTGVADDWFVTDAPDVPTDHAEVTDHVRVSARDERVDHAERSADADGLDL